MPEDVLANPVKCKICGDLHEASFSWDLRCQKCHWVPYRNAMWWQTFEECVGCTHQWLDHGMRGTNACNKCECSAFVRPA